MKMWMVAGAALALGVGGVALAQTPPAGPRPPVEGGAPPPPPGPPGPHAGGPEMWMHGPHGHGRGMGGRPPMGKAAFFRLQKGDQSVTIKCADDEPMKACVEAASVLLDKVGK